MVTHLCGPNTQGAIGTDGNIRDTAEHVRRIRQDHEDLPLMYPADPNAFGVCGPCGRDRQFGRPQEKAVVPDSTPLP